MFVFVSIFLENLSSSHRPIHSLTCSSTLEDCRWNATRIEALTKIYLVVNRRSREGGPFSEQGCLTCGLLMQARKSALRLTLRRTGFGLPHVVDVDWRLDYHMKVRSTRSFFIFYWFSVHFILVFAVSTVTVLVKLLLCASPADKPVGKSQ